MVFDKVVYIAFLPGRYEYLLTSVWHGFDQWDCCMFYGCLIICDLFCRAVQEDFCEKKEEAADLQGMLESRQEELEERVAMVIWEEKK